MPESSKFAGRHIMDAEPPKVWIQPHHCGLPPRIFVGNQIVEVTDKKRAAQWARVLIDFALSEDK